MGEVPAFSVDRLDEESRREKTGYCDVCGAPTRTRFFGYFCCEPYDENGKTVRFCKAILRDEIGG